MTDIWNMLGTADNRKATADNKKHPSIWGVKEFRRNDFQVSERILVR